MNYFVRPEFSDDVAAVRRVHDAAFPIPEGEEHSVETTLLDGLRADGDIVSGLTFVAVGDGELVGQITCSMGKLGQRSGVAIGPIGVLPDRHGQGIGTALMNATISAAMRVGEPVIVVLGEPDFYGRFGFQPASDLGIEAPDPTWQRYFQALALPRWTAERAGDYRYATAFSRL